MTDYTIPIEEKYGDEFAKTFNESYFDSEEEAKPARSPNVGDF